jgi:hypothetical protein
MTAEEQKLEQAISYVLIAGVIASVTIETIGIWTYYYYNQNLDIVFKPSLVGCHINPYDYELRRIERDNASQPKL